MGPVPERNPHDEKVGGSVGSDVSSRDEGMMEKVGEEPRVVDVGEVRREVPGVRVTGVSEKSEAEV